MAITYKSTLRNNHPSSLSVDHETERVGFLSECIRSIFVKADWTVCYSEMVDMGVSHNRSGVARWSWGSRGHRADDRAGSDRGGGGSRWPILHRQLYKAPRAQKCVCTTFQIPPPPYVLLCSLVLRKTSTSLSFPSICSLFHSIKELKFLALSSFQGSVRVRSESSQS